MKEIRWICIQERYGRQKYDWFNWGTMAYTRKASKELLSSKPWAECKRYGWRCVKVEAALTEI